LAAGDKYLCSRQKTLNLADVRMSNKPLTTFTAE